ncbi:hypothetical protein [Spirosoma koreense]
MNRITTLLLATVATLTLATSACKKESETIQPGNDTPAFVGKDLMLTSFQVSPAIDHDGDGKLDSELLDFMRPCDRDNTIRFEANGKLSGGNGSLSCSDSETDPSVARPGTWSYNAQTKTIRIVQEDDATDVAEWKVLEASAAGLKVEISVTEYNRSSKTTMTWKAI